MNLFSNMFQNNRDGNRRRDRRRSAPRPSASGGTSTPSTSSAAREGRPHNGSNQQTQDARRQEQQRQQQNQQEARFRSQPRPTPGSASTGGGGGGGTSFFDSPGVAGLDGLFPSGLGLGAAMANMMSPGAAGHVPNQNTAAQEQPTNQAVPPASARAIRQLPRILVSAEDLVDENNRECCICFDEHCIGDKVTRLPCAHIFHTDCITEWLKKHCTCPICRYELPTDDPNFEKEREIRMSHRKPRYAKYELERLNSRELIDLCKRLKLSSNRLMGAEKKEIIELILDSGKIDVIVAPKPIEYDDVQVLRKMGVGKLKKAMAEAGVFFDPKDVVEKEDMVQIFINSGRIVLLQTEELDESENDMFGYAQGVDNSFKESTFSNNNYETDSKLDENLDDSMSDDFGSSKNDKNNNETMGESDSKLEDGHGENSNKSDESNDEKMDESDSKLEADHYENVDGNTNNDVSMSNNEEKNNETIEDAQIESEFKRARTTTSPRTESDSNTLHNNIYNQNNSSEVRPSAFTRTSVAGLRELAQELNINISDCIEKKEMVDRIANAISSRSSR